MEMFKGCGHIAPDWSIRSLGRCSEGTLRQLAKHGSILGSITA